MKKVSLPLLLLLFAGIIEIYAQPYGDMTKNAILNQDISEKAKQTEKIKETLKMIVGHLTSRPTDAISNSFSIVDMDEMDLHELIFRVEEEYNISIPDEEIRNLGNINDMGDMIYQKLRKH